MLETKAIFKNVKSSEMYAYNFLISSKISNDLKNVIFYAFSNVRKNFPQKLNSSKVCRPYSVFAGSRNDHLPAVGHLYV